MRYSVEKPLELEKEYYRLKDGYEWVEYKNQPQDLLKSYNPHAFIWKVKFSSPGVISVEPVAH